VFALCCLCLLFCLCSAGCFTFCCFAIVFCIFLALCWSALLKCSILCDLLFAFCALLKHFSLWCSCFVEAFFFSCSYSLEVFFTLVFLLCWSTFHFSVLILLKHFSFCWSTLHFGVCVSCFAKCFVAIFFFLVFVLHN
jgi:hypothetical protein